MKEIIKYTYNITARKILPGVILALVIHYLYSNLFLKTFYPLQSTSESEIELPKGEKDSIEILSSRGRLSVNGWTRDLTKLNMIQQYIKPTTTLIKELGMYRYKKSEKYTFVSKFITFSIEIFNYMYIGGYNIYYSDSRDVNSGVKRYSYWSVSDLPSFMDNCHKSCYTVKYIFSNDGKQSNPLKKSEFYKFHKNQHKVKFDFSDKGFELELELTAATISKEAENFVNFSPIISDSSLFVVNHVINLMKIKGKMTVNKNQMNPDLFLVTYSSNFGVFPIHYENIWITANGITDDKKNKIGLNFNYGLNHESSKSTESALIIDSKVYKIGDIKIKLAKNFHLGYVDETEDSNTSIKSDNLNASDTNDVTCDMIFKPSRKLVDSNNYFYLFYSHNNISHGEISGYCNANNKKYEFKGLFAVIENHKLIFA